MGNCMETCSERAGENQQKEEERDEEGRKSSTTSVRVKVVLTKDELEWLILELTTHKQGMGLQQVLQEIHRNRAKLEGSNWKPSLDTITEIPEVPHMMDT